MKQIKRSSEFPPNFAELPDAMKVVIEEELYRDQLKRTHSVCPGDPRLTSMGADGERVSGVFGKRVQPNDDEEDEERVD
jgi:hypothetical protein